MLFRLVKPVCLAVCLLALALACVTQVRAQAGGRVSIKAAVVDKDLNVKPVPKLALTLHRDGAGETELPADVVTSFDGTVSLQLAPGSYQLRSVMPLKFEDKTYEWTVGFRIEEGKDALVELSNDNAKIEEVKVAAVESQPRRRRVTEEAELFKDLRDGVVTIEGELGHGTGFIVDDTGLILTNQHVVSASKELRVQFDRKTKVRATLLAEDPERDVAVLLVNLEACPSCKSLKTAKAQDDEPVVVEGERVFAIGSPLSQEKILTSGIVSKVEKRAIISDVNINPGNSGGPLFNSLGEVIGITTFGEQAQAGPGVSGIVRIEEAMELLERARREMKPDARPTAALMPTEPEDSFPIEAIKARLEVRKFETKPYKADVGAYDVMMLTPVYKFYLTEKDRIEAAREREKRNKGRGAQDTVDKYRNLRNWTEYAGQLKPVVEILAIPEIKATGKSLLLSLAAVGAAGVMIPPDFKFRADFYEMALMCDGEAVTPIRRGKAEVVVPMPSYYKTKNRFTYAGIYTFPLEAFDPERCRQLTLNIFSEENPTKPETKILDYQMRYRVWSDFDEYRKQRRTTEMPPQAAVTTEAVQQP